MARRRYRAKRPLALYLRLDHSQGGRVARPHFRAAARRSSDKRIDAAEVTRREWLAETGHAPLRTR